MKNRQKILIVLAQVMLASLFVLTLSVTNSVLADCQTKDEFACEPQTQTDYRQNCSSQTTQPEQFVLEKILAGRKVVLDEGPETELSGCFIKYLLTSPSLKIPAVGIMIQGATINSPIDLQNAEVLYNVQLTNCVFKGEVNLRRSHFARGLSFANSQFGETYDGPGRLDAKFARVDFDFNLRNAVFKNCSTLFNGMRIKSGWDLDGASFDGVADFTGVDVGGTLLANRTSFHGKADFQSLKTGLDASFESAVFDCGATFEGAISNTFVVQRASFNGDVDFDDVKVQNLYIGSGDQKAFFARNKSVSMSDITFQYISPQKWEDLEKLAQDKLDEKGAGTAQFYTAVEALLNKQGDSEHADDAYITWKNKEWWGLELGNKIYGVFTWALVGYGRRKERLLKWSVVFVLIGAVIFWRESDMKAKVPLDRRYYPPRYNGVLYSLDLFLPFVALGEAATWIPKSRFRRGYRRFHILVGHLLIPIGLAALAGLIK
jgi:hypothetical protein